MVKEKHFGSSLSKAKKTKKMRNYRKILWYQCQCSGSSQIPSQDDLSEYHQFLSLYTVEPNNDRTELVIYDTENEKIDVKSLIPNLIDIYTVITQLPNGELFCYGSTKSGITLIIDRNYEFRMLPSGTSCGWSSALYFDSNIYCFGGFDNGGFRALSRKFDLEKNRWVDLASFPIADFRCHSVIFNGNILISGYCCNNLWLYSIEIDSFSKIPYYFAQDRRKLMMNVERLYLIEWDANGFIYEGEDEYNWKKISKSGDLNEGYQIYCLYNKEKIYISALDNYYQFDLKKKSLLEIE